MIFFLFFVNFALIKAEILCELTYTTEDSTELCQVFDLQQCNKVTFGKPDQGQKIFFFPL